MHDLTRSAHTPRARLQGAAAVIAPLLLLASTLAYAAGRGVGEDALGGTIQVFAMAAFFLAFAGFIERAEPRLPRMAAAMTVMAALGASGGVGFGVDAIYMGQNPTGVPLDESLLGALALRVPGVMFPLSNIAIGLALWRAGAAPTWTCLAIVLGGITFPISRIGSVEALALVSDVLLCAGYVPLGLAMLAGSPAPAALRQREPTGQPA